MTCLEIILNNWPTIAVSKVAPAQTIVLEPGCTLGEPFPKIYGDLRSTVRVNLSPPINDTKLHLAIGVALRI